MADDTDTTGQAWLSDDDSATPAPAPAPTNPPTGGAPSGAVMPSYDDFKQQYVNAAAANEKLNGGNHLLGWLTGAGRNAAVAQAQAQAPLAYFKLLGAQAQAQGMQMDAGQTKAYLERSGFKVDDQTGHVTAPDGQSFSAQQAVQALQPPAATAPPPAAAPGVPGAAASPMPGNPPSVFNPPQPGPLSANPSAFLAARAAQAPQPAAPVGALPGAAPGGVPAPQNAAAAQRAFLMQRAMATMGLPKYMTMGTELMKLARGDAPAGTQIDPTSGAIIDQNTGVPIQGSTQQYAARGAGMVAQAQEAPRVAGEEAINANQAQLTRETQRQKANTDASLDLVKVNDGRGGVTMVPRLDIVNRSGRFAPGGDLAGTQPNAGADDNPYRPAQIKQVSKAQDDANTAAQLQTEVQQTSAALKQFGRTGPMAGYALKVLQHLSQLGLLSPADQQRVASGELANMDSNSIVGAMVKAVGNSRVPVGIFNKVDAAKPGILRAQPQLSLEALNQTFQRQRDFGAFAADYYSRHENASKLDAQTAFDKIAPPEMYASRVLPLDQPPKGSPLKQGYVYKNKNGQSATWMGDHFQPGVVQ